MFTSAHTRSLLRGSAALGLALSGLCAHADNLNPIVGGGLGAMAGALIGQSVGGRDGAMVGAAVGGIAGVSLASEGQRHGGYAPVYRPAPAYGYREVEQVHYYPVPVYPDAPPGWYRHGHGWERHDAYRRDWDARGGEHRGWDHHEWDRRD